jgi:CDP-diacylglycerol--glycerol-3-phosphate 3-phosphatidyltransferase
MTEFTFSDWRQSFAQAKFHFISPGITRGYTRGVRFIAQWFIRLDMNPNFFTVLGLVISMLAAVILAKGWFIAGGLTVALAGTCDMIDGMVARESGRVSKFGALFDSVIDRYSEVIVFFGLCYYFVRIDMMITSVVVAAALGGSLMVSYVRARAEGLGLECKVGMMQRPERLTYLAAGSFFSGVFDGSVWILIVALWIIAVFANFTALQRLHHVWATTVGCKTARQPEQPNTGIQDPGPAR